ncbi:MAG TPA: mycothiol synthase [Dehalococcoidia bacterium]
MQNIEVISSLEGEHVDELEGLTAAAKEADGHEPFGEHKFLRLKRGSDVAIGILAYEAERLVGYAHTLTFGSGERRRVSCELTVHPQFRRKGIGRTLLARIIEHARSEKAHKVDLWAYNDSPASRAIASLFAFKETRRLLHMHRHPGPAPIPTPLEGVSVRPFRPGEDDEMWLALNNRIFAGHPENGEWTLEDLHARLRQPWFRPEDLLILEVGGEPAGFHWLKVQEREGEGRVGEVYVIGTAPEQHGRGLGRFLLTKGLTHLSDRDVDAVAVYADQSNERAVALYWSLEFHHHHVDVLYSLALPAAA